PLTWFEESGGCKVSPVATGILEHPQSFDMRGGNCSPSFGKVAGFEQGHTGRNKKAAGAAHHNKANLMAAHLVERLDLTLRYVNDCVGIVCRRCISTHNG